MMEREFHPGTDHEEIAGQPPQNPRKKKNKMKNKRRFSDDQIKLLESIFESETKLEPRKKLQLARELGLQPRQVAIWFQNRRARWKSKQIEQDYRILKDNYDNLASKFESLKKEKQSLMLQLQNLSELLAEPHDMNKGSKGGADGSSTGGCSECGDTKCEPEGEAQPKPNLQQSRLEERELLGLQIEHAVHQPGEDFMSMEEYRNESPVSPEKLYGFDSAGGLFDHSCSSSQWFHFWS